MRTVRYTRSAADDELLAASAKRVRGLLSSGVTTLEVKSGYGLSFASEGTPPQPHKHAKREG